MLQYDTSPYLIFLVQYKDSGLTLTSAQDIRNRVELLPGGPKWHHQVIIFPPYTTRDPMVLYYRDGLEVIASLFSNPVLKHAMEYTPYRLVEEETGARAYGEFMSGDYAWDYVVRAYKLQLYVRLTSAMSRAPSAKDALFSVLLAHQTRHHSQSVPVIKRCTQCSYPSPTSLLVFE